MMSRHLTSTRNVFLPNRDLEPATYREGLPACDSSTNISPSYAPRTTPVTMFSFPISTTPLARLNRCLAASHPPSGPSGGTPRRNPAIQVILPENEPDLSRYARELARKLARVAIRRQTRRTGLLIGEINDAPARDHPLARFLEEAGFVPSPLGLQMLHIQEPRHIAEPTQPEPA